jgi:hypothetical protein
MDQARALTSGAIETAITTALAMIVPDAKLDGPATRLLGAGAVIDSVGFVSLLVSLEQQLPGPVDLASSFMNQPDGENSFSTVGSLTRHIQALMTNP